jgi:hypothetical protein
LSSAPPEILEEQLWYLIEHRSECDREDADCKDCYLYREIEFKLVSRFSHGCVPKGEKVIWV